MWKIIEANKRKSSIIKFFMFIVFLLTGAFYGLLVAASLVLLAIYVTEGEFQITINGFGYLLVGSAIVSTIAIFLIYLSKITKREKLILDDLDVIPYSSIVKKHEKSGTKKQLYNITTEMAIASGLGYTPDIYIMQSSVPNAFAVGYTKDSAKIVLTSSLIEKLNRDELQGVIAHEISHIVNYDCKLMTDAYTMLYFVYFLSGRSLAQSGSEMFESSSSSSYRAPRVRVSSSGGGSKNSSAGIIAIIALVVILVSLVYIYIIAPLLIAVLYSMLSKSREYLADACAVQFTRYPSGLMNALIKISQPPSTSIADSNAAIVNALAIVPTFANGKITTHPPVEQRIKILSKMAGSGLADYNMVYFRIMHKSICPNSRSLTSQEIVLPAGNGTNIAVMQALASTSSAESNVVPINNEIKLPENVTSANVTLETADLGQELSGLDKHRMVGELFEESAGYIVIECRCDTKLKIPPVYDNLVIDCPHCLRKYELNNKIAKLIPAELEDSNEVS